METNENINGFKDFMGEEVSKLIQANEKVRLRQIEDEDIPTLLPFLRKYRERISK